MSEYIIDLTEEIKIVSAYLKQAVIALDITINNKHVTDLSGISDLETARELTKSLIEVAKMIQLERFETSRIKTGR